MRYVDLGKLLRKRSRWGSSACVWKGSKLKEYFREYFNNKCLYTEVPLVGQDVNIDHFRPKAEITQYESYFFNRSLCNCGYSWLKNEPANYRACCIYANRVTGAGGKGNFFP